MVERRRSQRSASISSAMGGCRRGPAFALRFSAPLPTAQHRECEEHVIQRILNTRGEEEEGEEEEAEGEEVS